MGYLSVGDENDHDGSPVTNVSIVEKLSREQSQELIAAARDLYFFSSGEDLYFCFQKNMEELLSSVLDFAERYFEAGGMTDENMASASFEFSRLMLNLLGMFKSFLDHGEAALKRKYGVSSAQATAWKQVQSIEYDKSIAYRLFYNLRNYAQHVGMPPMHFSLDHNAAGDGVVVRLDFYKSELLDTYSKWSKDARSDLVNGNEVIPIIPMLDEWSHCFHRMVKHIQGVRMKEVISSATIISSLRDSFTIPENGVLILLPEPEVSECGQLSFSFQKIPEKKANDILAGTFMRKFEEY
ncbi:MAG: hypothetical protein EOO16_07880 [Chitinophagaceae bacterium]|nr:MAG: hypothetical protein EOO16_07880 [Chitinophagaceae bacterium]